MKKITLLVVLALVLTGMVYASGQSEEKPVEVQVMLGSHGQFLLEDTIAAFESEYPNVTVEAVPISSVPNESWQTYSTMFAAQDGSTDIISMYPEFIYHMSKAGWITELSTVYADEYKSELDEFIEGSLNVNVIEGNLYGIPVYADALLLYYRKDLLEKYGFDAPVTWDELKMQAKTVLDGENDPNLKGYIFQAPKIEGIVCNFVNFQSGTGASILDNNGKAVVNSPKSLEALEFVVDLLEEGIAPDTVTTHKPNDDKIQFGNGNAVFMNNWPFALNAYMDPESPVYGKVAITRMIGKDGPGLSCLGGMSLAINNYTEDKKEAWNFIKMMASFEWNKKRAISAGLLPARTAVYDDPELLKANPGFIELGKGAAFLSPRPTTQTKYYVKLSDILQLELNNVVTGSKSAKAALDTAQKEIEKLLAEE